MDQISDIAITITALICTGAVPWAYVVERRLSRIETRISNGMSENIKSIFRTIEHIEHRLMDLEKRK